MLQLHTYYFEHLIFIFWGQLLDKSLAPGRELLDACYIVYSEAHLTSLLYDLGSEFNLLVFSVSLSFID
jgi:fructose-1,6-bisphosphatase